MNESNPRSADLRGYGKVRDGAQYAGVSIRTFRDLLKAGLPHFRLSSGTILVAYRDIDAWLEQYRVDGSEVQKKVQKLVDEATREF